MSDIHWWSKLSTAELLDLRRRLVDQITADFGDALGPELEDLVQQAFLVLFQRRVHVRAEDDGLYRYLKTVARHSALDRVRALRVSHAHLPQAVALQPQRAPQLTVAPGPPHLEREECEKIWRIFCALDELDRFVLWEYAVEGRSIRSIARDVGLNWHRVVGMVEGALRRFRKELGP